MYDVIRMDEGMKREEDIVNVKGNEEKGTSWSWPAEEDRDKNRIRRNTAIFWPVQDNNGTRNFAQVLLRLFPLLWSLYVENFKVCFR